MTNLITDLYSTLNGSFSIYLGDDAEHRLIWNAFDVLDRLKEFLIETQLTSFLPLIARAKDKKELEYNFAWHPEYYNLYKEIMSLDNKIAWFNYSIENNYLSVYEISLYKRD